MSPGLRARQVSLSLICTTSVPGRFQGLATGLHWLSWAVRGVLCTVSMVLLVAECIECAPVGHEKGLVGLGIRALVTHRADLALTFSNRREWDDHD